MGPFYWGQNSFNWNCAYQHFWIFISIYISYEVIIAFVIQYVLFIMLVVMELLDLLYLSLSTLAQRYRFIYFDPLIDSYVHALALS